MDRQTPGIKTEKNRSLRASKQWTQEHVAGLLHIWADGLAHFHDYVKTPTDTNHPITFPNAVIPSEMKNSKNMVFLRCSTECPPMGLQPNFISTI